MICNPISAGARVARYVVPSRANLNDASLIDPEYDRLLASAAAKSRTERLDALGLAETRLLSGAAVLPMYHSLAANVVDPDFISGWYPNALDIHPFKYLAFGERRLRSNVAALTLPRSGERE